QYAETLQGIGFEVDESHLMTPASSAVDVFLRRGCRRVMVLGGEGLRAPLEAAGIRTVAPEAGARAEAVLVGWFREFNVTHLEAAVEAVWAGARLYSCSQSLYFASAAGRTLGTSRAISAMIRDLTGERITIVGKPSLTALGSAGRRLKARLADLAVVGDDPTLEIPMAHRGRALAIGVHGGVGAAEDFRVPAGRKRPHLVVESIAELHGLCRALHKEKQ